jgi:hypothetical protein
MVIGFQMDEAEMLKDSLVAENNCRRRTEFLYRGQDV